MAEETEEFSMYPPPCERVRPYPSQTAFDAMAGATTMACRSSAIALALFCCFDRPNRGIAHLPRRAFLDRSSWGRLSPPSTSGGTRRNQPSQRGGALHPSHGDYHFSLGVSISKVPKSLRNLAQRVAPVDDRHNLAGLKQLCHVSQALVWLVRQEAHLAAAPH